MGDLSRKDFKYYKNKLKDDIAFHETQFLNRINPDKIDDYFEGDPDKDEQRDLSGDVIIDRISINSIFPATSTLTAQFYPRNPKFIGIPKRRQDKLASKVSAAAMNYYYEQMYALRENQKVINAAWMYGIGISKQGWRTVFNKSSEPKLTNTQKVGGLLKRFSGPGMEEEKSRLYIESDGPFLEFVNPKNFYLDKDNPLGKSRVMHQHVPKSLFDIRNEGLYDVGDDFVAKFKTSKDQREVVLDLYESWWWLKDGLYVLVTVEGWDKPLRWDKSPYAAEGFPYRVLHLTDQVNRIYPISHMKVAQRLQRLSDYIMTLNKKHIETHKNIAVFDGDAFDADDNAKIKKNEIGLNLFTKNGRPASSAGVHIGGNTIPQEMFAVNDILRSNIKEILTVIGARQSGESELNTATQEKIADFGNQLRAATMQSQIKDFLVRQGRKLLQDLKQFATAPAIFKVTGLDLINPDTGVPVTEEWIEFATDRNPEQLKEIIPAEMDIGITVAETPSINKRTPMEEAREFVEGVVIPLQPLLVQEGKKFNAFNYIKKVAEGFQTISDADEFFDDIPIGAPQPNLQGGEGVIQGQEGEGAGVAPQPPIEDMAGGL